jgi:hypothetical protein
MITAAYAHFTLISPSRQGTGWAPRPPRDMFAQVVSLSTGAGERIRTAGLAFTRRLLCLLSYTGRRLGAW